jgi:hypothetical protein
LPQQIEVFTRDWECTGANLSRQYYTKCYAKPGNASTLLLIANHFVLISEEGIKEIFISVLEARLGTKAELDSDVLTV